MIDAVDCGNRAVVFIASAQASQRGIKMNNTNLTMNHNGQGRCTTIL